MKVIVNNLAIEYSDSGRGPVILMLHGWQDSHRTFDALATELGPGRRIVRPDLPGFGGSDLPPAEWSVGDYAELVAAFVAKLGIDVEVLIGHSLGGRIVLRGISSGQLHARRIVLIAAAGIAKSDTLRNRAFKAAAKAGKVATLIPPLSLVGGRLRRGLYRRAGSDYLDTGPLKATFLKIIAEDLQGAASAIKQPALLIWGSDDADTPPADGRRLAQLIPHSSLTVLPGAGHFVHQQEAAKVARLIEDFAA